MNEFALITKMILITKVKTTLRASGTRWASTYLGDLSHSNFIYDIKNYLIHAYMSNCFLMNTCSKRSIY